MGRNEKLSWNEVQELHKKGGLVGYYKLYDDNTEAMVESDYDWEEIVSFYDAGGEFGEEED